MTLDTQQLLAAAEAVVFSHFGERITTDAMRMLNAEFHEVPGTQNHKLMNADGMIYVVPNTPT